MKDLAVHDDFEMGVRQDNGAVARIAYGRPRAMDWHISIQRALEWAFAEEFVQLEHCWPADGMVVNECERSSVDSVWLLQQQNILGCRVDGGGAAYDPHVDALIIAGEVGRLMYEPGMGKAMVLKVIACARARTSPYWGRDETRRIVPSGWDMTDDGEWQASTRKLREASYRNRKGYLKTYIPKICPISYAGSPVVISKYRREYLDWYGAMLHLHACLRHRDLHRVRLNGILPELTPWKSS